jgi:hypothetical protein
MESSSGCVSRCAYWSLLELISGQELVSAPWLDGPRASLAR